MSGAPVTPWSPDDGPPGARGRPQLRRDIIERLLLRLAALYGVKFNEAYASLPMANLTQLWAEELASFSLDELNRGINGCRLREWPPTLPEFMVLCRPRIHPEEAYHEALANLALRAQGQDAEWSHPAVFHAAMSLTPDLQRQPWPHIKVRWCAALERHLANPHCPSVPPPPQKLAKPATRPPNDQEKAAIAALRARIAAGKKPLTSFRATVARDPGHPDDSPREAWTSPLAEPYAGPYAGPAPRPFHAPLTEPWLTVDTGEPCGEQDDAVRGPL